MSEDTFRSLTAEVMLSDEQLKAIGCLALESTHLELYIEAAIINLCGFDDTSANVFLSRLTVGAKAQVMRDLLRPRLAPEEIPEFDRIYGTITNLITKRNTVIHGDWGLSDILERLIHKNRGEAVAQQKWRSDTVKADAVMGLAYQFSAVQSEFLNWFGERVGQ